MQSITMKEMEKDIMNNQDNNNIDVTSLEHVDVARLETTNVTLQAELSSKESYIAILEERLLKLSVELASSRASEDEQNLMYRRRRSSSSSQQQLVLPEKEKAAEKDFVPNQVVHIKPTRNKNSTSRSNRRRSSEIDTIDFSTRSAPIGSTGGGLFSRRNTSSSNLPDDSTMSFSERSTSFLSSLQSSWGAAAIADKHDHKLRVDFPESRRPSSSSCNNESSGGGGRRRRRLSIGTVLFRKSDATESTATTAEECGHGDDEVAVSSLAQEEEGVSTEKKVAPQSEQAAATPRRRPSRRGKDPPQSFLAASSRSFLSCVVFPRDEEDVLLGFE
jgi:hypothetical protein